MHGAGPSADQADTGPPKHLPVGLGHVGSSGFMAADDELHPSRRIAQRIKDRQGAFTGHAEDAIDPMDAQGIDEDAAAVPESGRGLACWGGSDVIHSSSPAWPAAAAGGRKCHFDKAI
jgi:hypothetical protein